MSLNSCISSKVPTAGHESHDSFGISYDSCESFLWPFVRRVICSLGLECFCDESRQSKTKMRLFSRNVAEENGELQGLVRRTGGSQGWRIEATRKAPNSRWPLRHGRLLPTVGNRLAASGTSCGCNSKTHRTRTKSFPHSCTIALMHCCQLNSMFK